MNNRYLYFVFLLFLTPLSLRAQSYFLAGARGVGMGGADLNYKSIHSIFNNPAGLAYLDGFSATAFTENRFLLEELKSVSLGLAYPTSSGTIGLLVQYFGFQDFNEQKLGISYSRKLFDKLAIGAQFDLLNTRISEYGSAQAITFEVGLNYEIVRNITAGVHIFNPIRAAILEGEPLPASIQIGVTYQPADYLRWSISVGKDSDLAYSFRTGLEYLLLKKIFFRAGMTTNPNQFSFGLGYLYNNLQFDLATSYHQVLGFSPSIGISYSKLSTNVQSKNLK